MREGREGKKAQPKIERDIAGIKDSACTYSEDTFTLHATIFHLACLHTLSDSWGATMQARRDLAIPPFSFQPRFSKNGIIEDVRGGVEIGRFKEKEWGRDRGRHKKSRAVVARQFTGERWRDTVKG